MKNYEVIRHPDNPIITAEDIPFKCNSVFNAAAVKHEDEYILLMRVELCSGPSVLVLARSKNGVNFEVEDKPAIGSLDDDWASKFEIYGVEDPRITKFNGEYIIFYTGWSNYEPMIVVARTKDFKEIERIGRVSAPLNKNACLFPQKFDGDYVRLDRPYGSAQSGVWLSRSEDLVHWGESEIVFEQRAGRWDCSRVGAGAPPFLTDAGWLVIYHGVKSVVSGAIYRLGVVILDKDNPAKIIARSESPILSPKKSYERIGDISNVVFTCGAIPEPNGDVKIYYGGADTVMCLATTTVKHLINCCQPVS